MAHPATTQDDAVKKALEDVTAAAHRYSKLSAQSAGQNGVVRDGVNSAGELTVSHNQLFVKAMQLVRTIRGPVDVLFAHFENMSNLAATRALLELGVFDAIPTGGKAMTADELAAKTGGERELIGECRYGYPTASRRLSKSPLLTKLHSSVQKCVNEPRIVRLMRNATILGPFAELGPQTYAHTPYSEIYLVPQMRGVFKLMVDEYFLPMVRLHEFLRTDGFKNPTSLSNNPYTFAHDTKGKTMWEHIAQHPERAKTFNYAMEAQTQASLPTVGIYPFESELGDLVESDDTVVLVDVGGGKGQASNMIRQGCPGLKGRFILQDRPEVIADITERLPGIERMPHDFFKEQPVKGALAYYIRRCFHDWDDEHVRMVLHRTAEAMTPGRSRLLIAEMVIPATGADITAGWFDLTMMTLSGTERTEQQWRELLESTGFELTKVWTGPGVDAAIVEGRLRS